MICQACGVEAPTKYVAFYQNIGALVVRFQNSMEGNLCKSCVHRYYWKFSLVNFFLGWWGTISFFATPIFLVNNTVRYVLCLGMPAVPAGAAAPELTQEAVERLEPHLPQIFEQLGAGDSLEQVAQEFASVTGVTPGQVVLYVVAAVKAGWGQESRP